MPGLFTNSPAFWATGLNSRREDPDSPDHPFLPEKMQFHTTTINDLIMKSRILFYGLLIGMVTLGYLGCTDDDPERFTLTVQVDPAEGGSVSPASGTFDEGTQVTLTATPAEGYALLYWSGAASGNANPLVITMTSDKNITAVFTQEDADADGVPDLTDQCPDTPPGQGVDANGCASSQTDADQDGVTDDRDLCANTPEGETADANGCSASQKDADEDGVSDALDQCPDTEAGEDVDIQGCSAAQRDTDGDGITDDIDLCPDTMTGMEVDSNGCPLGTEYTYVPDDGFEQTLIDLGVDNFLDDAVVTRAIDTISELTLSAYPTFGIEIGHDIADFTGIEDFRALEVLTINGMTLNDQTIDLSLNTNLRVLNLHCDYIDNIDLSQTQIEELSVFGFQGFAPCESWINRFDLSGLTTLKSLSIANVGFADLNAVLSAAVSVEYLSVGSALDLNGEPVTDVDLSTLTNLKNVFFFAITMPGPSRISIKNGANLQLVEFVLGLWPMLNYPGIWEPCIEADDPAYIEELITNSIYPFATPAYTVTTDCGGGG